MKEMRQQNILEVIVYLLEKMALKHGVSDQGVVKQHLENAGFTRESINHAFDWLRALIEQQRWYIAASTTYNSAKTMRIFTAEETCKIDLVARSFILSLEQSGILDTKMREVVISQLINLDKSIVNLVDAKWVVLLVLLSKANRNADEMRNYLLTTVVKEA